MIYFIYFTIGFFYWVLNAYVRRLDTEGDWLLPLVWFLAWPLPILAWCTIACNLMFYRLGDWIRNKQLNQRF